ncbi:MAG: hypothetical protein LUG18_03090 [Candidatus Azobacteroides sp.]|nr:hypothetical protein [Candidatus Azobacteroides sp.]
MKKIFLSLGFRLTTSIASEDFGDCYEIYTNGYINFRLSSDRSINSIDISYDNKDWYDLALVKALLYNEKELNKVITIEDYSVFLKKELPNILNLFNDKNYLTTKKKLEELGSERAKQMFFGIKK